MQDVQKQIRDQLHVKPEINPKEEVQRRVGFLKDYCKKSGAKGFVLGISGGQDSTLAGKLSQLAVEELRAEGYEATFYSVRLPYGTQKDEEDAKKAVAFIQPDRALEFNIEGPVNSFASVYASSIGTLSDYNKGNVKARMRMIAQYAIAGEHRCLVVGTDHAAESITGFFTKFGDGGADLSPLYGLTKRQGQELLAFLKCPEELYTKIPTADLLDERPLQEDEAELGVTYEAIDNYLVGNEVSMKDRKNIEGKYKASQHKRELPATPFDEWWKK